MLLHPAQSPPPQAMMDGGFDQARRPRRKRKAESQDNERLSKRLGLLNLEQSGTRLYVPVENPSGTTAATGSSSSAYVGAASPASSQPSATGPRTHGSSSSSSSPPSTTANDSVMQLDDTKYKVYIYNLDDELSSSESEHEDGSGSGSGRLVFLPDIQKHLAANRVGIPPAVRPNADGELAGMQLVLYDSAPSSLSVPEHRDSVRKAIIEARARFRDRQRQEGQVSSAPAAAADTGAARLAPVPEVPVMTMAADGDDGVLDDDDDDPDAMDLS